METQTRNICPWPTFTLDKYTTVDEEYIETDLYQYVKQRLKDIRRDKMYRSKYILQINDNIYEKYSYSEHLYKYATADYSVQTQALIHGKALTTNRKMAMMYPKAYSLMCPECPL
jgi:hypothetical protein